MKDEKMKDKELWMGKLKEKLQNYSEPVAPFGWEQLEKELMASDVTPVPPVEKRVLRPYRRWTAVAAVALLLIASSISVYFLNTPAADEIRRASTPVLASDPDLLPPAQESDGQAVKVEPANLRPRPMIAQARDVTERQVLEPSVREEDVAVQGNNGKVQEDSRTAQEWDKAETVDENPSRTMLPEAEEKESRMRPGKRSGRDKLHLPVEKPKTGKGRWSVGAAVGNGGGVTLSGADAGMMQQPLSDGRLNMIESGENDIIRIPENQIVYVKEGMPYVMNLDEVVDIKHRQPVSFGLSVRKELSKGFSVETGVTYTLLSSDVQMAGNPKRVDQKLHYIGIPVRANWNFFDKDRFTLYVAAGGMVEKCVYGVRGSEKLTVNPLQLSVAGAVGAQFNATKHVGIYVEPGVAYFFDNGSGVPTIRKETPCNFNLQAGIRYTY